MLPPGPLLTPELVLSRGEPSTTATTLVLIKTTTKLLQTSFPKPCVPFLPLSTSHPSPSAVSVMLPQEPQLEMAQSQFCFLCGVPSSAQPHVLFAQGEADPGEVRHPER